MVVAAEVGTQNIGLQDSTTSRSVVPRGLNRRGWVRPLPDLEIHPARHVEHHHDPVHLDIGGMKLKSVSLCNSNSLDRGQARENPTLPCLMNLARPTTSVTRK